MLLHGVDANRAPSPPADQAIPRSLTFLDSGREVPQTRAICSDVA
jgi:hypothetical protein